MEQGTNLLLLLLFKESNNSNKMDLSNLHKEFRFRMSRSSGSGGQHVNKVSTRVELLFDVLGSQVLKEEQKEKNPGST